MVKYNQELGRSIQESIVSMKNVSYVQYCYGCGVCLDVCAFHKDLAINVKPLKCWAAWSNDERVRHKCSSGGVGFEIGKQLIEEG